MKLKATKVNKNSMFCVFLGGMILFALFYFSRQARREGITGYEYDTLRTTLGVITESPISEAIEADEQVRRDEAAINAARAAVNSAKANYDSAVKAYNASLKQANISRGKAAEANAIAAPEYEILLGNIRAIGITDELYALPVAETALGAPRIVYDMNTLVQDEVHIVG